MKLRRATALPKDSECFKLPIRWTDYIYDTYADEFNSILSNCVTKPWNFDKGGEKEIDADNPNAVKITLKASLTENELNKTRNGLFNIFEKAHVRYASTQRINAAFHVTNEILFPSNISGYVIGKKGQTLRGIKEKTGVDLLVVDDLRGTGANEPPPEGYCRLIIRGSSINSLREARENVEELLLRLESNDLGSFAHDDTKLQSAKQPHILKRAASEESVFEVPGPKHDKSLKFLMTKQPSSTNVEKRSFEPTHNYLSPKEINKSDFGRFFHEPAKPIRRVSQQKSTTTSMFNSQTTKTDGIQQNVYASEESRRDETYVSDNEDAMSAYTPAKKCRNGMDLSDEQSGCMPNEVQDSIMSFIKQSQESAKRISNCWSENERKFGDKFRRVEEEVRQLTEENRQLLVENRQLRAKLSKYMRLNDSKNRMCAMEMGMQH